MSKTIRVSKTEDKMIEHLRKEKEVLLAELKKNNQLEILSAITNEVNYVKGRAAEKNLNLVKRMTEEEINFLWYVRSNKERISVVLEDVQNAQIHKLYNLICHGYSRTFDDLIEGGMLTKEQREHILHEMRTGRNILITGKKDTGKTVLLNALLHELSYSYLIVDALSELQTDSLDHCMFLHDIQDFSIRHFHLLKKDTVLVLADIHCDDDFFVLEHINPGTQVLGIIYDEEKLNCLTKQWEHRIVIRMDHDGQKKYVRNIE